jgi:predicted tellurium resistance membrane protein TerC
VQSGNKIISKCTLQIIMIDLVFSFDSILTAVGMTNGVPGALYIMITAVVISVLIMMQFAVPVGSSCNKNPSIQILGCLFFNSYRFMLLTESAHLSNALIFKPCNTCAKGYLYFAISFLDGGSNMKAAKKEKNKIV